MLTSAYAYQNMLEVEATKSMIRKERVKTLNKKQVRNGSYVLYWMQASPRSEYNPALECVILNANELNKPSVVFFGITDLS